MKEFVYLLNKEGVLLIVESEKPKPCEIAYQAHFSYNNFENDFKEWFTASNKYPCADVLEEAKFLKQISKDNDWTTEIYSTWFNNKLAAGIKINKENVRTSIRITTPSNDACNVAYFVSPPLVIGGEETQEKMAEHIYGVFTTYGNKKEAFETILSKFHITRK